MTALDEQAQQIQTDFSHKAQAVQTALNEQIQAFETELAAKVEQFQAEFNEQIKTYEAEFKKEAEAAQAALQSIIEEPLPANSEPVRTTEHDQPGPDEVKIFESESENAILIIHER